MSPKKILLVDDEVELVDMLKLRLEANGYQVISAHDGMNGLKKAREEKPDLVVLDLMLPKLDGYQVCRMMKFDSALSRIPIIMLTALSRQEDKEWGKRVKADAYLTKPFSGEELLERINNLLKK